MNRRVFLRTSATTAGLAMLPLGSRLLAQDPKKPLAVILYTLRDDMKADFDGTLRKVAEIGYTAVEFAGYSKYRDDPAGLLDEALLRDEAPEVLLVEAETGERLDRAL